MDDGFQRFATRIADALDRMIRPLRTLAKRYDHRDTSPIQKPEGFEPIRFPVAGVTHQSPQWVIQALNLSEPVWLRREANDFDMNAISVETRERRKLGYIGRTVSARLAPFMATEQHPLQAVVTELTRDVSGGVVGMAVSLYLPAQLAREIRGKAGLWASYCDVGTDGVTYLFIDCDEAELEQVNDALRRNALPWRRSGLSYRAAPDGRQYRWYVRLESEVSQDVLRQVLDDTLGPSHDADSAQALNDWIAQFDEEKRDAAKWNATQDQVIRELRDRLSALQARMADLERAEKPSDRQRRGSNRRELGNAIGVLLPGMLFLKNSLDVIIQELESFEPVLRELRSLCSAAADVKGERVEGAREWKERRFSTGQKDDGRLYFRNDGSTWLVLVSFKGSQKQDIEYLKSH